MKLTVETLRLLLFAGWRKQALIVLAMLAGALAENLSIASLWPIFNLVSDSSHRASPAARLVEDAFATIGVQPSFGLLLVFLSATAVGKFVFSTAGIVYVGRQIADQSMRLRLDLIDAVTRARWPYLISIPQGRLTAALGDESERAAGAFSGASRFVMKTFETLAYLAGCLLISWHFSVAALLIAAVLWLVVAKYIRKARRAGRRKWKSTHLLSGAVADLLTSMKTLRAMNRHAYLGRFASRQISVLRSSVESEYYSATAMRALQEPLLGIMLIAGVYGGYRYFGLGLVDLIATVWLLRRVADGVAEMRAGIQKVAVDGCAFWSVTELTRSLRQQAEELRAGKAPLLRSQCRFQGVNFSYGAEMVIESVDFDLPLGEVTALTGRSGEGKTSIADLLVGLLEPESGQILVDGVPLADIDLANWRSRLGYIPQDNILFNVSVFENIALGDKSITESDAINALKLAGAWNFVSALPAGIHEVIGVRGNLLSGGQKQRLSIARALVHRPQLLILDEATSALDVATATGICNAIRGLRGERAILAITHQPVWMEQADRVLTLGNGKVRTQAGASR